MLLEVAAADRRSRGIPDSPVERELTTRLLETLRCRLGPAAAAASRAAAGVRLDDIVAQHRSRASSRAPTST